jgi:hypothetical protein
MGNRNGTAFAIRLREVRVRIDLTKNALIADMAAIAGPEVVFWEVAAKSGPRDWISHRLSAYGG